MKLLISSDHAGFPLKEELKKHAAEIGVEFEDLGTHSLDSVDYPDYADLLCEKLKNNSSVQFGVIVCGSGIGVSIAANRYAYIRAVLAESEAVAKLGREHNHANVLCMGARIVTTEKAITILKSFLNAKPDLGERHSRRVEKLGKKGKS